MTTIDVTIYHNPRCSTSRNVLQAIEARGIKPQIIEYLKNPPSAATLLILANRAGCSIRDFLRKKEQSFSELGLDNLSLSDEEIAEIMHQHPELINRPIVATPYGVVLCRPAENVEKVLTLTK